MRIAALAFVSVLALAACNPNAPSADGGDGAPAASAAGDTPPQANGVSFRQEATIIRADGGTMPQVLIHDGAKIRTEMAGPGGSIINIVNSDTHEAISIMQMGGRTIATRTDISQAQQDAPTATPDQVDALRAQMQSRAHRGGACSAAGENGTEWAVDAPEGAAAVMGARTMCITNDGIMIQMKQDGRLVFDTQRLERGPQDPSLFAVPPGVEVTTRQLPSRASIDAAVARARAAAGQAAPAP